MSATESRRPWRKNLYENTEYEDNYTDPSFLQDLRTNVNVQIFTVREAIAGATIFNNQISCITGFLIVFHSLYSERITPTDVLVPSGLITAICYACYCYKRIRSIGDVVEDSKTLLTVLLFGYLFAPILHTLTDTISTDTIFSMTFFVMLINLIFCDYGLSVAMVSKAISLNAAIFGSICLASRLSSSYHAFVLLVEAAVFFVLYPILVATFWRPVFLVFIFVICCYSLYYISHSVLIIYVTVIAFINLIFPLLFVYHQRYKNNIHGPWDEAIVEETTDSNFVENL